MEEEKRINSNRQLGIYVISFIIIGLVIICGILFWNNQNKITDDELFVAKSISEYKKYLGAKDSDFKVKEIRLYGKSERI